MYYSKVLYLVCSWGGGGGREHRGQILGRNPGRSFKSFPPCYSQSPLQLCLRFLFLQTHATFYSFCKGERRKTLKKTIPLPYGLRNPYRNDKSENSHDYAQNLNMIVLYFHEFVFSTRKHCLRLQIQIPILHSYCTSPSPRKQSWKDGD